MKGKKEGLQGMDHECGTRYLHPISIYRIKGMRQENGKYYKHLTGKIVTKRESEFSKVINYIKCRVAYIALRSTLLFLRGSRTVGKEKLVTVTENIDLGHDELLL